MGTEAGENQDTGRTDHPKHLQWGQHKRVITNLSDYNCTEKGVFWLRRIIIYETAQNECEYNLVISMSYHL